MNFSHLLAVIRHKRDRLSFYLAALTSMRRKRGRSLAFVVGSPFHENLGDHAQSLCAAEWIRSSYPQHDVVLIDTMSALVYNAWLIRWVQRIFLEGDLLFAHSGYHMTDLYPREIELQRLLLRQFSGIPIVFLPQTVNFANDADLADFSAEIENHGAVTIVSRDVRSHEVARENFPSAQHLLFPDIVTREIGRRSYGAWSERAGIQLCLRRDRESVYVASGEADRLERYLSAIAPTTLSDTESELRPTYIRKNLKSVLERTWRVFSRYKVTVTDRYHGVIFSLIAGTPVVVLGTTDHKLRSGVAWFPSHIFERYVFFAETVDQAVELAAKAYGTPPVKALPPYFETEYYSQLRAKIEVLRRDHATDTESRSL
ncbi:polysaccharide pyruvyl transferase family protein [Microbacterium testaceum]|uniref:polysaccharide pyruvyl transferase family protein n=1 Tax=Microbacterium testaceum TaxID=2033 RepID=UPI001D17CCF0|nr:polysaccharide pyruvyl transferase family protein [Microbacterium testaceum]MCC4249439.1 polysaccharide pyruvyl transferase family protein [Microbacterium testaceum]